MNDPDKVNSILKCVVWIQTYDDLSFIIEMINRMFQTIFRISIVQKKDINDSEFNKFIHDLEENFIKKLSDTDLDNVLSAFLLPLCCYGASTACDY